MLDSLGYLYPLDVSTVLWFIGSFLFWFVLPGILLVRYGRPRFTVLQILIVILGCAVGCSYNGTLLIERERLAKNPEIYVVTATKGFPIACMVYHGMGCSVDDSNQEVRRSLLPMHRRYANFEAYVPMFANAAIWFWGAAAVAWATVFSVRFVDDCNRLFPTAQRRLY